MSMAYTGRLAAKESKFKHQNATPAPKPCRRTSGVFFDSTFIAIVHILALTFDLWSIRTCHPLYAVCKTKKQKLITTKAHENFTLKYFLFQRNKFGL
jgi:hypothetical protein